MTNLDWYSNLNVVLTYCAESDKELVLLTADRAHFNCGNQLLISDIKRHLHHRASAQYDSYVHHTDGTWSRNGEPCDAPEVD
jgi:hypothetical protein